MRRSVWLAAAVVHVAATARADDIARARALWEQGRGPWDQKDYAQACRLWAEADALGPKDPVLEGALRACSLAGDAALSMELADRADERASTRPEITSLKDEVRQKFSARVGRIRLCDGCTGSIDDVKVHRQSTWVTPGSHVVTLEGGSDRTVGVAAGATVEVQRPELVQHPRVVVPPPIDRPQSGASGISPWWFWSGVVVSAGLTAATIGSFVDAGSRHEGFATRGCATTALPGCVDAAAAGRDAEARSYVLLGFALGATLATTAIGLFAVRWNGGGVTVSPTHVGLFARY